jgi:hypothetical protein
MVGIVPFLIVQISVLLSCKLEVTLFLSGSNFPTIFMHMFRLLIFRGNMLGLVPFLIIQISLVLSWKLEASFSFGLNISDYTHPDNHYGEF